ncbi:hypothetical protein ACLOJK_034123 [Asimina triloba]
MAFVSGATQLASSLVLPCSWSTLLETEYCIQEIALGKKIATSVLLRFHNALLTFANTNPFDFKFIQPLKSIENFDDVGQSVVMASAGGLPSGLSRLLFDRWRSEMRRSWICRHADFAQTSTFLKELMPPNIVLVHGEANEMGRLKQKLITQFADKNVKNCQTVEMYFKFSEKMAETIGRLAEKSPEVGETKWLACRERICISKNGHR